MSAAIDYRRLFNERALAARERMLAAGQRKAFVRDVLELASPPPAEKWRVIYRLPIGPSRPRPTAQQVIRGFCYAKNVSVTELFSNRRTHAIVLLRHELFWTLREQTTLSLPQIGRAMGGRDHTTVLHGIRRHERRMKEAGNEARR
jgi:hypothetical protein